MRLTRCCLLLLATALFASDTSDRCGVDGFVTSDVAAVLPGATIGIDSVTRGFHRRTLTDTSGYYLIEDLQPGAYSMWAEVKGLGCIVAPQVAVFAGKRVRRDFRFLRAKRLPDSCEPLTEKVK